MVSIGGFLIDLHPVCEGGKIPYYLAVLLYAHLEMGVYFLIQLPLSNIF